MRIQHVSLCWLAICGQCFGRASTFRIQTTDQYNFQEAFNLIILIAIILADKQVIKINLKAINGKKLWKTYFSPSEKQHIHNEHKNQAHNNNSWTYRPTYASYQLSMEYTLHVIIRLHAIYMTLFTKTANK